MYLSKILKNFGLMRLNLNRPITDLSVSEQILISIDVNRSPNFQKDSNYFFKKNYYENF